MLEKLDEHHQKWLISDEEREFETFVAEGLGEWADIDQTLLELEAMRLDFSVSFDYDLRNRGAWPLTLGGHAPRFLSVIRL